MEKTFLTVHYSQRKDCFVAIPRNLDGKLVNVSSGSNTECTVLKIQTADDAVYMSISRDRATEPDTLEINGLYAAKLGIKHGDQVMVSYVTGCPCEQVYVEPLSVNDWEILELHANFVEANLLNQVRVVWQGQTLPIWVSGSICIFVDIGKLNPACDYAILQANTEVIVAPKDRRDQQRNKTSQSKRSPSANSTSLEGKGSRKTDFVRPDPRTSFKDGPVYHGVGMSSGSGRIGEQNREGSWGIMNMMKNLWTGTPVPKLEEIPARVEVKEDRTCRPDMLDFEFEMLLRVQPFLRVGHRSSRRKSKGATKDNVSDSPGSSRDGRQGASASTSRQSLDLEGGAPDIRGGPSFGEPMEIEHSAPNVRGDSSIVDSTGVKGTGSATHVKGSQLEKQTLLREGKVAYKQPVSVFVDFHTVQKWWTPGRIIPEHFLAKITKILSPTEKEEYKKSNPEKPKNGTEGTDDSGGNICKRLRDEISGFVRVVVTNSSDGVGYGSCANHVTMPDRLRQVFNLDATGSVMIEAINAEPSDITKLTLYPVTDVSGPYTKEMITMAFQSWLRQTTSYSCPVVLNNKTIVSFRLAPSVHADYLVSLASEDTTPGPCFVLIYPDIIDKLDILVTPGSSASATVNLMLPAKCVKDIDPEVPKSPICLGGVDHLLKQASQFLDMSLAVKPLARELFSDQTGVRSGCLLICGAKGAGKSLFCKELCERFSKPPHLVYVDIVQCMTLRGKRADGIQKVLSQVFSEAEWRQPSIVVLDDLDHMCSKPTGPEQEMSGEALYYLRNAEVVKAFLREQVEKKTKVAVVATVKSMSSVHPILIPSRGIHYFQEIVHIKPPNQVQRHEILANLIDSHQGISPQTLDEIDLVEISRKTEGFIPRDLSKVIDRAFHAAISRNYTPEKDGCVLEEDDFDTSLCDFTPSALHNVSLHVAGDLGWDDVGGLKNVKSMLEETLLLPAKYPKLFAQCRMRLRSGILLYGPPGTGKTLLAGVVAKECGLHFISIKGPELLSKYIGASEQAVRDTFTRAQSAKPCILFFDEFDSIAPRRGHDSTGVTDRVVNQLLTQLDGVESLEGVYVLAASSRPDLIDPALLRPGRLDKSILCPLPSENERLEILQALTRTMSLDDDVDLAALAGVCEHFTGADFKGLLYSAQLEAIHGQFDARMLEKSPKKGKRHLEPQIQKVVEKPRDRIMYIPSLGEGVVELAPDMENKLEVQVANLLEPFKASQPSMGVRRRSRTASMCRTLMVTQDHLMKVAHQLHPSVSPTERMRYQKIYESFVSSKTSKGGTFGSLEIPGGKRATLA